MARLELFALDERARDNPEFADAVRVDVPGDQGNAQGQTVDQGAGQRAEHVRQGGQGDGMSVPVMAFFGVLRLLISGLTGLVEGEPSEERQRGRLGEIGGRRGRQGRDRRRSGRLLGSQDRRLAPRAGGGTPVAWPCVMHR